MGTETTAPVAFPGEDLAQRHGDGWEKRLDVDSRRMPRVDLADYRADCDAHTAVPPYRAHWACTAHDDAAGLHMATAMNGFVVAAWPGDKESAR